MLKIFDPNQGKMRIAVGVSGPGTNYERIRVAVPGAEYLVFSNIPECEGLEKAGDAGHSSVTLSSSIYSDLLGRSIPRKGVDRNSYDRAMCTLIEQQLGGKPDLICLAGYGLWIGDWMVDRYNSRILNVHPGDTTKGFDGYGWIPSAKAILAEEESVKSTLFFVDKSDDGGPVFIQSEPVAVWQDEWASNLEEVMNFASRYKIETLETFREVAENENPEMKEKIKDVCCHIQGELKKNGDWKIYPFGVQLINDGRVRVDGRTVYIDDMGLPKEGYQMEYETVQ